MEKKKSKIKIKDSYDDLIYSVMNRPGAESTLKASEKNLRGRPGRYKIDVLEQVEDGIIIKKIHTVCDVLKEQQYVSMIGFSKILNVSYGSVWKYCNVEDPPLPHKKNKIPKSTVYVGDHKKVKEWLLNYGKSWVAGSILRDQQTKKEIERLTNDIF